jgi:predicted nucleic acid-binding protein
VLSTYLRRDLLVLPEAMALMQRAEVLLAGQEQTVTSEQVLRLAHSSRCSAYDCEFIAAAQQLGVPLVTEDRAVLAAFPEVAMPLDSLVA